MDGDAAAARCPREMRSRRRKEERKEERKDVYYFGRAASDAITRRG
jgi:hypothetical protein